MNNPSPQRSRSKQRKRGLSGGLAHRGTDLSSTFNCQSNRTSIVQFEIDAKRTELELEPDANQGTRGTRNANMLKKGSSEQVTNIVLRRKNSLTKRGKSLGPLVLLTAVVCLL